ncbi:tol-pal system protein YbgF [Parahaliea sp. F7430]|uniref:Cell division coordinator CpoB n=1 Tax=Sediminihaliea albiluteola TaxID=2758564 RepID=A0A7W2YJL1_9GAMM|nr:tol-pal system protein YbgF [Sediminihaliea albiluteola]MBA6413182.1 tol-pal system protein YbgF [Sediminihaliea albiluteola]
MRCSLSKALAASGLALVVSPFCFVAQAQDYIDVEAERRAAQEQRLNTQRQAPAQQTSQDPFGVQPAQSYPATSYGVNNAPAASGFGQQATAAGSQQASNSGSAAQLLLQLQQLQQEVMRLNGQVEEQAHELRILKEQSLERYVDLDRRVSTLTSGGVAAAGVASESAAMASATAANTTPTTSTGAANVSEQPGEANAYRAAYALVRSQQFDQAVSAFKQFLRQYPSGRYAPNAHYWLGELYLVIKTPDLESSRQAFTLLIDQYPDNAKVPDALYKLGQVHFRKGNREKARGYFDRVIKEYGGSNNTAAKLSQDFINENY